MTLRFRLIISYLAMTIIPIFLTAIAAVIIFVACAGSITRRYNLGHGFFGQVAQGAVKISTEVDEVSLVNPDKLMDMNYLESLEQRVKEFKGGIIVKKDEKILYSSKIEHQEAILAKVGSFKASHANHFDVVTVEEKVIAIKQRDFTFSDNSKGSILVLGDLSAIGELFGKFFSLLSLAIILILVLTNGIITFLVSRSIIRPLSVLKRGTEQIKEGNLDFQVKCFANDEIGDVCVAFEQMRRRLKGSIEEQLKYEENRKELISSISHDLKTPITSIKGYVEGILDGVADSPEKMEKYIRTIYAKAADMDRLIDDLFLFSKLDLKKLPFNFEKVDIREYFSDCMEELQVDMEKKGIRFSMTSDFGSRMTVVADREKLKRVVMNILHNSAKYMDKPEGVINIKLKDEKERILVKIEDNGRGISQEEIPYIFDRFYRADPSRNTSTGGSGLGLAIAKQVVEGHGGHIWAESRLNEGTSMFFTLKKAEQGSEVTQ